MQCCRHESSNGTTLTAQTDVYRLVALVLLSQNAEFGALDIDFDY